MRVKGESRKVALVCFASSLFTWKWYKNGASAAVCFLYIKQRGGEKTSRLKSYRKNYYYNYNNLSDCSKNLKNVKKNPNKTAH